MRVALVQSDIVWEDPPANFARLRPWIAVAAATGARLVALPEMFACGFSMRADAVAEPEDGPTARFLRDAARRHGLWLAGSMPLREAGAARPHNALVLAGPDGEVHRYRKQRPFTHAGEDRAFAAGEAPLTVAVEGLRLSLFVCYDLRFADLFWPLAPATDAYLVVANWPETRREHWTTLLRARAIENQAYVLGVNRVGSGGPPGVTPLRYVGDSVVIDPAGAVLAAASEGETLLLADVEPGRVAAVREALPFLRDRR